MEEALRGRLNKFLVQISTDLDYRQVILVLRGHNVLDENDSQEINNSAIYPTDADKRAALVDKLQQRGKDAYWLFCHALKRRSPHLYDALHTIAQDSMSGEQSENIACPGLFTYVRQWTGISDELIYPEQIKANIEALRVEAATLSATLREREVESKLLLERCLRGDLRIAEKDKIIEGLQVRQQTSEGNARLVLQDRELRILDLRQQLESALSNNALLQKKEEIEVQDYITSGKYVNAAAIKTKNLEDSNKQLADEMQKNAELSRELSKVKHLLDASPPCNGECHAHRKSGDDDKHSVVDIYVNSTTIRKCLSNEACSGIENCKDLMNQLSKLKQVCAKLQIEKSAAESIVERFHLERKTLLDQEKSSEARYIAALKKQEDLMQIVNVLQSQVDDLSVKLKARSCEVESNVAEKWQLKEAELSLKIEKLEQEISDGRKMKSLPMERIADSQNVQRTRECITSCDGKSECLPTICSDEEVICYESSSVQACLRTCSTNAFRYLNTSADLQHSLDALRNRKDPNSCHLMKVASPLEIPLSMIEYPNTQEDDYVSIVEDIALDFKSSKQSSVVQQADSNLQSMELNCKTGYVSVFHGDDVKSVPSLDAIRGNAWKGITVCKPYYEDFGFVLEGGNQTGTFVKSVENWSPAQSAGVKPGWRLLKVNNAVVANAAFCYTREVLRCVRHDTVVEFSFDQVPYNDYKHLMTMEPYDKFYVRALVDYCARSPDEISFHKGDYLCVTDSFVRGEGDKPYRWRASLEDSCVTGCIPRQLRDSSSILHYHAEKDGGNGSSSGAKNKKKRGFVAHLKNQVVRSKRNSIIDVMDQLNLYDVLGDKGIVSEVLQEKADI